MLKHVPRSNIWKHGYWSFFKKYNIFQKNYFHLLDNNQSSSERIEKFAAL